MKPITILVMIMLWFGIAAVPAAALTEEEIAFYLQEFFKADEARDVAGMSKITGLPEEMVKNGFRQEEIFFEQYSSNLGFKYVSHRWTDSKIIFIRPFYNVAFISQVMILKFTDDTNTLRKQEFYTIFQINLDEDGTLKWMPVGQSRGGFVEVGKGS
jgi:hypothetical protein